MITLAIFPQIVSWRQESFLDKLTATIVCLSLDLIYILPCFMYL